MYTNFYLVNMI